MWWVSDEDADGYTAFAALLTSDVSHREHVWRVTLRPASITKDIFSNSDSAGFVRLMHSYTAQMSVFLIAKAF
jgi:hypothetical protein